MAVKFANLASTTLASSLSNTATSISVTSSSSFPTLGSGDYFYASIGEGAGSEVVKVTGVSSDTFTVVRGQDGTSAQSWSSGTVIALRVVAAALDDMAAAGDHASAGYITGYTVTESDVTAHEDALTIAYSQLTGTPTIPTLNDTLDSVTDRGATTTNAISTGDHTVKGGTGTTTESVLTFENYADTAHLKSKYTNPSTTTETYLAFHTNKSGESNGTVSESMRLSGNNLSVNGSISAAGINNATGEVIDLDNSTYTIIRNPENASVMYLGDSADRGNYYDNNTHHFRNAGGGTYLLTVNSGGANVRSGSLQMDGSEVIDSSRNISAGTISGTLASTVTATTQAATDDSTKVATTAYVTTAIDNIVGAAPGSLNTLQELADALGDDDEFSTTVTNSIATKLAKAGGTMTGNLTIDYTGHQTGDAGLLVTNDSSDWGIKVDKDGTNTYGLLVQADGTHAIMVRNAAGTQQALISGTGNADFEGTVSAGANAHFYTNSDRGYVVAGTNDSSNQHLYLGSYHGTTLKELTFSGSNNAFYPQTSEAIDLGLSTKKFKDLNISGSISSGAITSTGQTNTFYSGAANGSLAVGRSSVQSIKLFVNDGDNSIIAYQDADGNSTHNFILQRDFDGTGANNFLIRKGTSTQLQIDTNANATFYGNLYIPEYIYHGGDTNTYIRFENDQISIVAGGTTKFHSSNTYLTTNSTIPYSQLSGTPTIPTSLPANGGNADTVDSLHAHSSTIRQNQASKLVSTDGNGYIQAGWINTTSGATTNTLNRIYASNDGYIRYVTPATLGSQLSQHINYNNIANKPTIPTSLPANGGNSDTVDGYHATDLMSATSVRQWSGLNASSAQAKRYTIMRLYICPAHWEDTLPNIKLFLHEESYESSYLEYHLWGDYNGGNQSTAVQLQVKDAGGYDSNRYRVVVGSPVDAGWDHSGQNVYYYDIHVDVAYYKQVRAYAYMRGHGYTTTTPTSNAGITLVYTSPSGSNISDFSDVKTSSYFKQHKIWNEANDGTGSGLDADLLDGQQGSHYLNYNNLTNKPSIPSVGNGTMTITAGASLTGGGSFTANQSGNSSVTLSVAAPADVGSNWRDVVAWSGSALVKDSAVDIHGSGYLRAVYLNMTHGVGTRNSDTVFYSSTDDYIRKNNASGMRTSLSVYSKSESDSRFVNVTGDTMTGELNVTRNGGATGTTAPSYSQANIELQTGSNHAPAISFHRGGYSAVTLYEYDGELYSNPWTTRAQAGKLISSGNYDDYVTASYINGLGINYNNLSNKPTIPTTLPANGGNADTVDNYHAPQNYNSTHSYLGGYYQNGSTGQKPNHSKMGAGKLTFSMQSSGNLGFGGSWNDVLWMSSYSGGDVKKSVALVSSKYDNTSLWIAKQNYDSTSWGTGYLIWNSGNDGAGSGLDADKLDGEQGSYYLNYNNLSNRPTIPTTLPANGGNADTVGGVGQGSFMRKSANSHLDMNDWNIEDVWNIQTNGSNADVKFSVWSGTTYGIGMHSGVTLGHLNDYAMTFCMNNDSDRGFWWGYSGQAKSAGAMSLTTSGKLWVTTDVTTPSVYLNNTNTRLYQGSGNALRVATNHGYVDIGPQNSSWCHIQTDRANFYFNKPITVDGGIVNSYNEDLIFRRSQSSDDEIRIYDGYTKTSNPIRYPNGGNAAPSITFTNDTDTGIYRHTTNTLGITAGGTRRARFGSTIFLESNDVRINAYLYHNGDTDTHLRYENDRIIMKAGGVEMLDMVEGATDYVDIIDRVRVTAGGNLECEGNVTAYSTTSISDINQKENIEVIDNPIEKIKQISGYTFDWKNSGEHSGGVIAQEIEKVMPSIIKETSIRESETMKAVDYQAIIGLLVETVKDLNQRIEDLENGNN